MRLRAVEATRYVTPFREGGSLPAVVDDRRRAYVVKFLGAGRARRRSSPRSSPASSRERSGCPSRSAARRARATLGAASPTRRSRTCCAPASVSTSGWTTCPARSRSTRRSTATRAGPRGRDRLVRRVRHQRRPHAAQHQPAHVARAALADRPRRGALLPPRGGDAAAQGRAVPAIEDHVLLPLATAIAEADARLAPRVTPDCSRDVVVAIPDEWLDGDDRRHRTGVPARAAQRAARVRRRGRGGACAEARSTTR